MKKFTPRINELINQAQEKIESQSYQVIYSSQDDSENGLYLGTQQIASARMLRKLGHDVYTIVGWSQSGLAKIAKQVELYFKD